MRSRTVPAAARARLPSGANLWPPLNSGTPLAKNVRKHTDKMAAVCPHCGFTQADFKKAGRLGCSDCYKVFAEGLEGLLKTMHKGTRHVGKVPAVYRQSQDLADKLKSLQKKLEKAIASEDFESAASLRDEVKALRAQMSDLTTK